MWTIEADSSLSNRQLNLRLSRTDPGKLPVKQGSMLRAWLIYEKGKSSAVPDYINGVDLEWAPEHAVTRQKKYISLANSNAG